MKQLLTCERLVKRFQSVTALNGVTINIDRGQRVALLGHNGAGKTTLFRAILGFIDTDEGSVLIAGHKAGCAAARQIISYLPENVAFSKVLTGREILTFYAKLKGVALCEVAAVLVQVDLSNAADLRSGTYSKGMRQRLGLAQALLGVPELLLLDEPTSGLDPLSRQHFYEIVSHITDRGAAVLMASHGLSELEAKTDRIVILKNGRTVADAPIAELQHAANLPIRIRVKANPGHEDTLHRQIGGVRVNGSSVQFDCPAADKMKRLSAVHNLGEAVADIDVSQPSLDEIYQYYSNIEQSESDRS